LGYVGTETHWWGLDGNGSETSCRVASHSTVRHYFVVLFCFFNWAVEEGFVKENPMAKIKVAKSKAKVMVPFSREDFLAEIPDFFNWNRGRIVFTLYCDNLSVSFAC